MGSPPREKLKPDDETITKVSQSYYKMEDLNDVIYRVMADSRETAAHALIEDALTELTALVGDPDNRLRLLCLVALDDMQAASVNEDEKERLKIAKGGLDASFHSRIPVARDPIYETAFAIVEDALAALAELPVPARRVARTLAEHAEQARQEQARLPVYHALLPVHQRMVEEEEAAHQAELRAIEEAEERAYNEEVAAALRASEELVAEQARLAEELKKQERLAVEQPMDPAARRALALQAIERRKANKSE